MDNFDAYRALARAVLEQAIRDFSLGGRHRVAIRGFLRDRHRGGFWCAWLQLSPSYLLEALDREPRRIADSLTEPTPVIETAA